MSKSRVCAGCVVHFFKLDLQVALCMCMSAGVPSVRVRRVRQRECALERGRGGAGSR